MLNWGRRFSIFVLLDSHGFPDAFKGQGCLVGAGVVTKLEPAGGDLLIRLAQLHSSSGDYIFGHIGYDFKNILEPGLESRHPARLGFPDYFFFVPETVCSVNPEGTELAISSVYNPKDVIREILDASDFENAILPKVNFKTRVQRDEYLAQVAAIREHIAAGDCYELNYCVEGYCDNASIDATAAYQALSKLSPAPFSAFYRLGSLSMACASPERYVRKQGTRLVCQPIKGTAARGVDQEHDERLKSELFSSAKERAENVMIVDLMRNDLARCCKPGTVTVEELFGIYTFPRVHQMISTVSGMLRDGLSLGEALRCTFPMGSMTGAPKYKVMQLIDRYEASRRELFSGTLGYIAPNGDFDFNVVIRSIFYRSDNGYLSYQSGGAITYDSVPEAEWDELKLKSWAIERIFAGNDALNSTS